MRPRSFAPTGIADGRAHVVAFLCVFLPYATVLVIELGVFRRSFVDVAALDANMWSMTGGLSWLFQDIPLLGLNAPQLTHHPDILLGQAAALYFHLRGLPFEDLGNFARFLIVLNASITALMALATAHFGVRLGLGSMTLLGLGILGAVHPSNWILYCDYPFLTMMAIAVGLGVAASLMRKTGRGGEFLWLFLAGLGVAVHFIMAFVAAGAGFAVLWGRQRDGEGRAATLGDRAVTVVTILLGLVFVSGFVWAGTPILGEASEYFRHKLGSLKHHRLSVLIILIILMLFAVGLVSATLYLAGRINRSAIGLLLGRTGCPALAGWAAGMNVTLLNGWHQALLSHTAGTEVPPSVADFLLYFGPPPFGVLPVILGFVALAMLFSSRRDYRIAGLAGLVAVAGCAVAVWSNSGGAMASVLATDHDSAFLSIFILGHLGFPVLFGAAVLAGTALCQPTGTKNAVLAMCVLVSLVAKVRAEVALRPHLDADHRIEAVWNARTDQFLERHPDGEVICLATRRIDRCVAAQSYARTAEAAQGASRVALKERLRTGRTRWIVPRPNCASLDECLETGGGRGPILILADSVLPRPVREAALEVVHGEEGDIIPSISAIVAGKVEKGG